MLKRTKNSKGAALQPANVQKTLAFQNLNKRFGNIKGAVSDLHRDVTTRRCLTSYERVEAIVGECAVIKTELEKADSLMETHRSEFDQRWQAEQVRIKSEQAVFNDQLLELAALRNELKQLLIIAQQLEPYIRSISALMERIQPQVAFFFPKQVSNWLYASNWLCQREAISSGLGACGYSNISKST